MDTTEVCGKFGEYYHAASKSAFEARIAVGKMEQHITNAMSTREIITSATQQLDGESKSQLQQVSPLSRNVRNWRQTANGIPLLPTDRTGYDIPISNMTLPDDN